MALLLDAAAEVFAEVGYGSATTNAIAARAGVSPGSLYQFFSNKEALAEALAERYVDQLEAIYEVGFPLPSEVRSSLDVLLDRMVDPLVAFNVANPAFQILLSGANAPRVATQATQRLHEAGLKSIDAMLAALAPQLTSEDRQRRAHVCKHMTKALLPLILAADSREREQLVMELKKVLRGYLAPLMQDANDPTPLQATDPSPSR